MRLLALLRNPRQTSPGGKLGGRVGVDWARHASWPLLVALVGATGCNWDAPYAWDRDAGQDGFGGPLWPKTDGGAPQCLVSVPLPQANQTADVLVLFDRSGSMSGAFGNGTRYSIEAAILKDLIATYQDKLRFGFQAFPAKGPCPEGYVVGCCAAAPSVSVDLNTANEIAAAIDGASPVSGNTPTAQALRLAREHYVANDRGADESRYVILSTDGRPSCAISGALAEPFLYDVDGNRTGGACWDALVEMEALVSLGVKVVVLGIGLQPDQDPGGGGQTSCLEELALAGRAPRAGPGPSYYPAADPQMLEKALQTIFGGITPPSCLLQLDRAPPTVGDVSVFMDGREIPRNRVQGWEFDSIDDTRYIRVYGEYCRRLERFQVATVEVRHGCPPCLNEERCIDSLSMDADSAP